MHNFYFTFGCGSQLSKRFVKIAAHNDLAARLIMMEHFGNKWAFNYSEASWVRDGKSQEEEFGYTLLVEFVATEYDEERAHRESSWEQFR